MKCTKIILGLIIISACSDDPPNFCGDYLTFKLNEAQILQIRNGMAVIEITGFEDSRCPSSLVCIRAGEVYVDIKVSSVVEDNSEEYTLCLGDCLGSATTFHDTDTLSSNMDGLNFKLVLHEVYPYPTEESSVPSDACIELYLE